MTVCLDASVAAAVLVPELLSARAKGLLAPDGDLVLTAWCAAETSSVFARRVRDREITPEQRSAAEAKLDLWRAHVRAEPVLDADLEAARRLVVTSAVALTAPDALHLAVALRLGAELATLDGGLAKAARAFGVPVRI